MTAQQAAAGLRVRCLVPDLDDEFLTLLGQVEEILMAIDPNELHPTPAPLAGDEALYAMRRVWEAVHISQGKYATSAGHGRLLAPDGRLDLLPLRVVDLPADDLKALAAAGIELQRLYDRGDDQVVDVVHEFAVGGPSGPPSAFREHERDTAGALTRVCGLLTAATDPHDDPAVEADAVLLIGRLAGAAGIDGTLSRDEYEAYRRVAVAGTKALGGDAIDLIKFGFFI
ncbi:hypothetical protein JNW91_15825 [Micromonospora sp. STR1_7]|uniref:Co-chaperone DjlA N-terminal domain-containing protein n=1 Tax=Micromonospora parastrephiae TaxID=2806101 RepID=A0ABS1XVA7_9ACTN|nr:hypothetical protein [Micromonospora parastrephiae]MBM0233204.1 hypothetical protein [Micromonospora parastrephiae]